MRLKSVAFLITSLVMVVTQGSGVAAQDDIEEPIALESKLRTVTIIDGLKYVTQPPTESPVTNSQPTVKPELRAPKPELQAHKTKLKGYKPELQALKPELRGYKPELHYHKPEQRPPSKPPIIPPKQNYHSLSRPPHGHIQKIPPPRIYPKQPFMYNPNSLYKFPRVIPLPAHYRNYYYTRPLAYAASTGKYTISKSPKFSLPVQVVNGIRTDVVRPPKFANATTPTTSTTTETTTTELTTTTRVMRTKRIWPKALPEKINSTSNSTLTKDNSTLIYEDTASTEIHKIVPRHNTTNTDTDENDNDTSESLLRHRYVYRNATGGTTDQPSTTSRYRPVTRTSKVKPTTVSPIKFTKVGPNDWVPILPSHYPHLTKPVPTPINKRSDVFSINPKARSKQMMYLQSFGLLPMKEPSATSSVASKKMVFFKRKRPLNPHVSGYSARPGRHTHLEAAAGHRRTQYLTKIKHHHHHHHHRYIKTVEKPVRVPYKVEVPKPYPVTVEKQVPVPVEKIKVVDRAVPYPVTVEKKVPYPIGIKIPHPVPVKVIEKEYVPKPYPVVRHVPVVKHVEVKVPQPYPVTVEKKVPYPVHVKVEVPVDRPVPVPVHVEKRVPYPVPVKVLVPQPYPVEKKVPYPVQVTVKEPVEVFKHVPVKVPYPQPYPVRVPHPVPVPVEKMVPYPVEIEKKVPYPVEVYVPQRVEVEKKVPVYIPKPYPVERKVPYPVRVPYPVKVPVHVPVFVHRVEQAFTETPATVYTGAPDFAVTHESIPQHTVTVHGSAGFTGFHDRVDHDSATTARPTS